MNSLTILSNHPEKKNRSPFNHQNRPAEKKQFFEIRTLQWLTENYLLPTHRQERLSLYGIIWFRRGGGVIDIDSKLYEVKNNSVYCFVPGQLLNYKINDDVQGYRIAFSPDFLYTGTFNNRITGWLDTVGANDHLPVMEVDAGMQMMMEQIVTTMQSEFANYFLLRAEILTSLLHIMLIHISRKMPVNTHDFSGSKEAALVRRFKVLIKERYITKKLVANYASELCVSPNYLNRTVKKITGFPARYHIQQHIVLEAKRQAIHSNGSMKEIAYSLGFDDLAHFSKYFKNISGINFTRFKKDLVAG